RAGRRSGRARFSDAPARRCRGSSLSGSRRSGSWVRFWLPWGPRVLDGIERSSMGSDGRGRLMDRGRRARILAWRNRVAAITLEGNGRDQPRGTMRCTDAHHARVAELVDASDSKSDGLRVLWVRVPPRVPSSSTRLENRQVLLPRADLHVVAAGHHADDLADVGQVVDGPRGEELAQGHGAE